MVFAFFVKFEQVRQLAEIGLDAIMEDVIPWCISEKVYEESSSTLRTMFNEPDKDIELDLAKAMVEIAAISDGLLFFVKVATYWKEMLN